MGFPHKPHPRESLVLSKHFGEQSAIDLDGWRKRGGYVALEKALRMAPAEIVQIVKDSGLRGRGGAGPAFATTPSRSCPAAGSSVIRATGMASGREPRDSAERSWAAKAITAGSGSPPSSSRITAA